jgi:hypothetical protein
MGIFHMFNYDLSFIKLPSAVKQLYNQVALIIHTVIFITECYEIMVWEH